MRLAIVVALFAAPALTLNATSADCPFDATSYRDAASIRAQVSRVASIVAPAATTSRRRGVTPPPLTYPAHRNYVDDEIAGAMRRAGINAAPLSSDAEFLRRVTLDLAGRIPTVDEVRAFLASHDAGKRDAVIDRLLQSEDFNDRWTLWFGDLVQNVYVASDVGQGVLLGRTPYYHWIRDSIAAHKPYDAMVRELLTSAGDQKNGPANYFVRLYQENGPPQDTFDNVATQSGQQFLAMPMNCVSCHDGAGHLELVNRGLSRVKRRELWGMAAFFPGIRVTLAATGGWVTTEDPAGQYTLTTSSGNKSPRHPPDGASEVVEPQYLGGGKPADGENRRAAYARMLTADPQFARAAVNYVWKELFGLGIIEPVNNFDLARLNPDGADPQPTHPALLEHLAADFAAGGYDLRALMRLMTTSSAYQLSSRYPSEWKESMTPYFARRYPRRMLAEVLLDALYNATGRTMSLEVGGHGKVTKAVATPEPNGLVNNGHPQGLFLVDFGEGNRDSIPRTEEPSLIQTLGMMNDPQVLAGLKNGTTVAAVTAATSDPAEVTSRLYLATLSRPPSAEELAIAVEYLNGGPLRERAEDLQFVLLDKLEFLYY
jgi:hypothetical protein